MRPGSLDCTEHCLLFVCVCARVRVCVAGYLDIYGGLWGAVASIRPLLDPSPSSSPHSFFGTMDNRRGTATGGPCKYFGLGNCHFGGACRFSHEATTPLTKGMAGAASARTASPSAASSSAASSSAASPNAASSSATSPNAATQNAASPDPLSGLARRREVPDKPLRRYRDVSDPTLFQEQ